MPSTNIALFNKTQLETLTIAWKCVFVDYAKYYHNNTIFRKEMESKNVCCVKWVILHTHTVQSCIQNVKNARFRCIVTKTLLTKTDQYVWIIWHCNAVYCMSAVGFTDIIRQNAWNDTNAFSWETAKQMDRKQVSVVKVNHITLHVEWKQNDLFLNCLNYFKPMVLNSGPGDPYFWV